MIPANTGEMQKALVVLGCVSGVASVNSPAYDWAGVAECAGELHSRTGSGIDGQYPGPRRMFDFPSSRPSRTLIACGNRIGDAMRYRPHG